MKILVTGFHPFAGYQLNPSEEVVRGLKHSEVEKLILPVSYDRAFAELRATWNPERHAGILMFGQAGGRSVISLERFAVNWAYSMMPDEDGKTRQGALTDHPTQAFANESPLEAWKKAIEEKGTPTEVSFDAGGFVCNSLYFRAAELTNHSLFVHLPYLHEQGKTPALTRDQMINAAETLIDFMIPH